MIADLWWWSWLLTAVGIAGLAFAGSKRKVGWALGLYVQVLWVIYAIVSQQYGFVVSAFAFGFAYARNWFKWSREEREAREAGSPVLEWTIEVNGVDVGTLPAEGGSITGLKPGETYDIRYRPQR